MPLGPQWNALKKMLDIISWHFDHCHKLDIVALCYHTQFQQNCMKFEENLQKGKENGDHSPVNEFADVLRAVSQAKDEGSKKRKVDKLSKS